MSIEGAAPARNYEEALRSLGLVFDENDLGDVMVVELSSGFGVTGLRAEGDVLATNAERRYRFIETHFSDDRIAEASARASGNRGTRHRANRNEQAFRLLGRYIDRMRGRQILIVDQGDAFLVRMLIEGGDDMPHRFVTISSSQLDGLRAAAMQERARS